MDKERPTTDPRVVAEQIRRDLASPDIVGDPRFVADQIRIAIEPDIYRQREIPGYLANLWRHRVPVSIKKRFGPSCPDSPKRWRDVADGLAPTEPPITIAVALQLVDTTRETLSRAVRNGDLTDRRVKPHAPNAPLLLDRAEVVARYAAPK